MIGVQRQNSRRERICVQCGGLRADVVISVLCIVVGLRPCRPPPYLQELFKSARTLTHKLKSFNVSVKGYRASWFAVHGTCVIDGIE